MYKYYEKVNFSETIEVIVVRFLCQFMKYKTLFSKI